jgi:endogenous inhibitor of DNA gyrase (YacG/DUF329 family)
MEPTSPRHVPCPQCGAIGPWPESPTSPFCSERCKLLDLEGWVSGRYAIPGEKIPAPERGQKEEDENAAEEETS